MSWDNWDAGKPKLDEARFLSPDAPKHRSKKDRKRWCRGKVGVEHVPEIKFGKWASYMRSLHGPNNPYGRCGWTQKHAWTMVSGERLWLGTGSWSWKCEHEFHCSSCGKILRDARSDECPDRAPLPADPKCDCYSCTKRYVR